MITQALRHCFGVGQVRLAQLHDAGLRTWDDVIAQPTLVPRAICENVLAECNRSRDAYEQQDIAYFIERLHAEDRWRILSEYLDQTSYFDIETSGFEIDAEVTVIACWHQGQLHTFVEHENLDDFLHLLDDVKLLASFNGSSFDVPRVLDAFHIPDLPCPHLDLRWPSYHAGLTGGLKEIATSLGIQRPADIAHADGELAIQLWSDWIEREDSDARDQLVRYCAADVMLLLLVAQHLAGDNLYQSDELWALLPPAKTAAPAGSSFRVDRQQMLANLFGQASPSKLRTRKRFAG